MTYDVFPLDASPERAEILSGLMRKIASTENVFSDFTGRCDSGCIDAGHSLTAMCPTCKTRMQMIASTIVAKDSRAWEVWRTKGDEVAPIGIIFFNHIQPGLDALGHYIFFDEKLSDKTELLREVMAWAFEDHPEEAWLGLRRITVEIPKPFAALARHASRKLGFGGAYNYTLKETEFEGKKRRVQIRVEGVKPAAVKWRGSLQDLLILGLQAPSPPHTAPVLLQTA